MAQGYDNYYGDSYSQYPTDDKKYECRTGPFEGFFVSSVEFCKHVTFDDKKDHRDTKVGPPGQVPQALQVNREFKESRVYKSYWSNGTQGYLVLKVNQELLNSLMARMFI